MFTCILLHAFCYMFLLHDHASCIMHHIETAIQLISSEISKRWVSDNLQTKLTKPICTLAQQKGCHSKLGIKNRNREEKKKTCLRAIIDASLPWEHHIDYVTKNIITCSFN